MRSEKTTTLHVLCAAALLLATALPSTALAAPPTAQWPTRAGVHASVFLSDDYEPDDSTETAQVLLPGTEVSMHTFHADDDEDWQKISAPATGSAFVLETLPSFSPWFAPWDGKDIATMLTVYEMDETGALTELAANDDSTTWPLTHGSTLYFVAPHPGDFFVRVSQPFPNDIGDYTLFETMGIARRIAGGTRYATAAELSRNAWQSTMLPNVPLGTGPDVVIVATGEKFPDALTGGVLAELSDTSVLLTLKDSLPIETETEIRRLATNHFWAFEPFVVVIVGGSPSVASGVAQQLMDIPEVTGVMRLAGANRFETAADVARADQDTVRGTGHTAFIVTGENFPDAMAAVPVAAAANAPVLLTQRTSVPAATLGALSDLGITNVVLVGGPQTIDPSVQTVLQNAGYSVVRIWQSGDDRYTTARRVAQYGVDNYGMNGTNVELASGENFPDGLTSATLARWTNGPLLLTRKDTLPPAVSTFLSANGPMQSASYVVGGTPSVSDTVYHQFQALGQ